MVTWSLNVPKESMKRVPALRVDVFVDVFLFFFQPDSKNSIPQKSKSAKLFDMLLFSQWWTDATRKNNNLWACVCVCVRDGEGRVLL